MRRTHLHILQTPTYHMADMEHENFNSYMWQIGYRRDFKTLPNCVLSTLNNDTINLGGKNWILQNTGVPGAWLQNLELTDDGLRLDFKASVSTYGTFTGFTMPYLWINPVALVPELESDKRVGQCGPGQPLGIVAISKDNSDAIEESAVICCINGTGPTGSSLGLGTSFTAGIEAKWYRDELGVVTSRNHATTDRSLLLSVFGGHGRGYWAPRVNSRPRDPRNKPIWETEDRAGSSFNQGATGAESFSTGKVIALGGYTGNNNFNYTITFETLEVWYIPNFEDYDTV